MSATKRPAPPPLTVPVPGRAHLSVCHFVSYYYSHYFAQKRIQLVIEKQQEQQEQQEQLSVENGKIAMKIQISFCLTFPSFVFCGNISSQKCGTTMANSMLTQLSAISTCRALAIRNVSFSLCRLQMRLFPQPRPQSAECEHECARPVRHSHDLFLLLFGVYLNCRPPGKAHYKYS